MQKKCDCPRVIIEEDVFFVSCLGKIIKGAVFSVIADNLCVDSVSGFVESFRGSYICRFCVPVSGT